MKTVDYDLVLTFEQVKEIYAGVEKKFRALEQGHKGLLSMLERGLSQEDKETLEEYIRTLLPLGAQECVEQETKQKKKEETLDYQIEKLTEEITSYLIQFKGNGKNHVKA